MSTQLFLLSAASDLGGSGQLSLGTSRGGSSANLVTNTAASGTSIPVTQTAGGTAVTFFSGQLQAVTISGALSINIRGQESSLSANTAAGIKIERCDSTGSVLSTILAEQTVPVSATEYTTGGGAKVSAPTPTSTSLSDGDRIKITLLVKNFGVMAAGFTVTNSINGPSSGASGDTWVTFAETLTAYTASDTGTGSVARHKMGLSATGHAPLIGTGSVARHKMGLSAAGSLIIEVTNNFEGGTDGTAITTANSGGSSGTAWDSLGGSTTLPTYSAAAALTGGMGAATPLSSNSTTTIEWKAAFAAGFNSSSNPWYGRHYFEVAAYPPVQTFLMKAQDDVVPQDVWAVFMDTTGHMGLRNRISGTNLSTATTAVSLNSRNRYEFKCIYDGTTFALTLRCFYGSNADGTTPDETITGSVTSGDAVNVVAWGAQAATSQTWTGPKSDNIMLTTRGWPGPAAVGTDTGTGSVARHKMGLSGTAKEIDTGTGSVSRHKMGLAGSGVAKLLGTGSIARHKMGLSGILRETEFGTGSVNRHKMGLSGTAVETDKGTGSVSRHKMGLSGSGVAKLTGTGSIARHKMGLSSSGTEALRGTGTVARHKMGLSGSGTAVGTGNGAVSMHKPHISGSGTETDTGTGSVRMHKMVLSGTAKETDTGSGSVHMHKMALTGESFGKVIGTGSVTRHKMGASGSGVAKLLGTGSAHMHKMGLSGTAVETNAGTGSVQIRKLYISGSGTEPDKATVSVQMHKMGLSGTGVGIDEGFGLITIPKPGLSGSGLAKIQGTGSIRLRKMNLPRTDLGSGGVAMHKPHIHGADVHPQASALFIFTSV
jgi:hypothetical protein